MRHNHLIIACLAWLIAMPIFGQGELTPQQVTAMRQSGIQRVKSFENDLNN